MGGKRWTQEDKRILKTLYTKNIPLKIIRETLNRTPMAIKGQVMRNGYKRKDNRQKNHKPLKMIRGNANTVGTISELQVFIECEKRGWKVFKPLVEGNKSDCIIKHYKTGTTYKIQIKTASYNKLNDNYKCDLSTKNKGYRKKYKDIDVDYFIIKCDRLDTYYIIPYGHHNKHTKNCNVRFYPHRMKQFQIKGKQKLETFRNKWGVIKQD